MHDTSFEKMRCFVECYLAPVRGRPLEILDFGSQVVDEQGLSYRGLFDDPAWTYRGLDVVAGHNVDVVVTDPYDWTELGSDSVDLVISGQAFEHVEYFWASMFEIVRVLRPGGVCAIIAPSGGVEHRYPVDCWRFYTDGLVALANYAGCEVVDAFTDWGHGDWEDAVLVARKPEWSPARRDAFARRARMQRAVLTGDATPASPIEAGSDPVPSVLRDIRGGTLTERLEQIRTLGVAAQAEAARAEFAAHVDDVVAARLTEALGPPHSFVNRYLRARTRAATLAGARGRAAYRRLRRRV